MLDRYQLRCRWAGDCAGKIAVDLRLGMFINEFCGSWMEHPFWKAKFMLKSEKDLLRIRESGVHEVWIDTSKGLDIEAGKASRSEEVAAEAEARLLAATVEQERPQRASLDDEVARALKLCSRSREAVVVMFSDARMGLAIETGAGGSAGAGNLRLGTASPQCTDQPGAFEERR